jgi:hypothetical protein
MYLGTSKIKIDLVHYAHLWSKIKIETHYAYPWASNIKTYPHSAYLTPTIKTNPHLKAHLWVPYIEINLYCTYFSSYDQKNPQYVSFSLQNNVFLPLCTFVIPISNQKTHYAYLNPKIKIDPITHIWTTSIKKNPHYSHDVWGPIIKTKMQTNI